MTTRTGYLHCSESVCHVISGNQNLKKREEMVRTHLDLAASIVEVHNQRLLLVDDGRTSQVGNVNSLSDCLYCGSPRGPGR